VQVQGAARHAFGSLLERQAKADRIRLVLGLMQRYEAIVQLPSRVRQHAEAGDYEQVRRAFAVCGGPVPLNVLCSCVCCAMPHSVVALKKEVLLLGWAE
jgi:hypothetical protein